MPCENCNSKLLLFDVLRCPRCENYKVLDLEDAVILSKKRMEFTNELWENEIKKYVKDSIIAHFTWDREKICRKFVLTYGILDLGRIFSTTLFLKRVMKIKQNDDAVILDDEKKLKN